MPRANHRRIERPFRNFALPLLAGLDRLAQRLISPHDHRIGYASTPDYADSSYAVYRHLLRTRRDLEHVWYIRDMELAERVRSDFEGAGDRGHRLLIRRWNMRAYPSFLRCRYVFHTHGIFGFSKARRGRVSVCLWHGMPVKAIRRLHEGDHEIFPVHGTVHLATSSFFRYVIAGAFDVHPSAVLLSGLPRTDVLKGFTAPEHDREAIARNLGLDPRKRWLLWMPTHRSEPDHVGRDPKRTFLEAIDPELIEAIDDACSRHGVQVIVKLHPFDLLNARPVELQHDTMVLLTAQAWASTGIQLYDLVASSDALITDISSIFVDYLHTGKPIGVVGYEASSYTRRTLFDPGLLLRCEVAHDLRTPADVEKFVVGISQPSGEPSGAGDLSVVFNEDHAIASTAFVVDAVGL